MIAKAPPPKPAPRRDARRCPRCGTGLLEHYISFDEVGRRIKERHIYTCVDCGRWFWTRERIW